MTRYGEMGSPAKLRMSSTSGTTNSVADVELGFYSDSHIEVTCLSFNPVVSKLLLVGTGHGQLSLYTTGRGEQKRVSDHLFRCMCLDEPILTLSQAFRSSSTVLSCSWSAGRPSVFFAHDSQGYIKYWDLTKDAYQPVGQAKVDK